jgi:hypothetical protein
MLPRSLLEVIVIVTGNFDNRDNLCESSLTFKRCAAPLPLTETSVALAPPPSRKVHEVTEVTGNQRR